MFQDVSGCLWKPQDVSRCLRMSLEVSGCLKMCQNNLGYLRFYLLEEIEIKRRALDLRVLRQLFLSQHTYDIDVQTISHKRSVLPLKEYSRLMISDPAKK